MQQLQSTFPSNKNCLKLTVQFPANETKIYPERWLRETYSVIFRMGTGKLKAPTFTAGVSKTRGQGRGGGRGWGRGRGGGRGRGRDRGRGRVEVRDYLFFFFF